LREVSVCGLRRAVLAGVAGSVACLLGGGCDRHTPAAATGTPVAATSEGEGSSGALPLAEVETPRKPVRGESDEAAAECSTSKAKA
jgi:hypothetical protein